MATIVNFIPQDENAKPVENGLQDTTAVKPSPIPEPQAPVQEVSPAEQPELEEEDVDDEEEQSDIAEEEEEEYDEAEDEAQGEQCEEVDAPLTFDEESSDAIEMANQLGLNSTDDALSKVGEATQKRVSLTLSKYAELISHDKETEELYDNLTQEITVLRGTLEAGVAQLASQLGISLDRSGIEAARSFMENYLRLAVERSSVHCEYREQTQVVVQDVLSALAALGRPLYWNSQAAVLVQQEDVIEDEQDGDYQPGDEMEDDEESVSDEEDDMETWDGKDEPEDEDEQWFENNSFYKLVDVVNKTEGMTFSKEAYQALQASVEDYIFQLLKTSAQTAQFACRPCVVADDVRFAKTMAMRI